MCLYVHVYLYVFRRVHVYVCLNVSVCLSQYSCKSNVMGVPYFDREFQMSYVLNTKKVQLWFSLHPVTKKKLYLLKGSGMPRCPPINGCIWTYFISPPLGRTLTHCCPKPFSSQILRCSLR